MSLVLNCVYLIALIAASPWMLYTAITKGKYRQGWTHKLFGIVPKRIGEAPCVWLHGVSVGEINVLAAIAPRLKDSFPEFEIVVSSTTRTGFELAKKRFAHHSVFYCPFDFSWAVRNVLRRVRPDVIVLGELELWPNLVRIADAQSIDVAVVNGRLSQNSFRGYQRILPLIRSVLRRIRVIAAQSDEYASRFVALGARQEAVFVTGSTKFDGAETDRTNSRTAALARIAGLTDQDCVFLAGSTQAPEEQFAINAFRALCDEFPALKLIIVPRHPERFNEVARSLDETSLDWRRRSELCDSRPMASHIRVLLIDTIGELGDWWGTAEYCFVGGSMGDRGGQNMIEPAAYGSSVSFGPNTKNFRDVVQLMLAADAATVVRNGLELTEFLRRRLENSDEHQGYCERSCALMRQNAGATDRTIECLSALFHRRISVPLPLPNSSTAPIRSRNA
ncbi:MAG: 3-deoxy-D-manno-octulosonic acid transferase [Planctomycetales bacterium]|nr:3-deoxy-D-manno-octulosonic acid transferase [Planctomycetales bacterium]